MNGAYSKELARTNGHLQGSSWSLDDIKLLMCVWTKRQHRYVPRSLSTTFVDDSNSTTHAAADLQRSLDATTQFDTRSGQRIHPGKVAGWALTAPLHAEVVQLQLNGAPLRVQDSIKIVGSHVNVAADPPADQLNLDATQDVRVRRAAARFPRISRLPMGMEAKARQARSLAASVCTTGADIQAPSVKAKTAYNHALLAAIRPKGNKWVSFWALMAVCVPGHALELDAIMQREVLVAVRRQARRDPALDVMIKTLRDHVQRLVGGGAVGRLVQTLEQLQ